MLFTILTIVHVLVCLFLIGVVLLQSGKAADLAGAFGGMGSQTAFGPRGSATMLSKLTTGSAIVFMVTSLTLSIMATRGDRGHSTVLDKAKPSSQAGKPAAPVTKLPVMPGAPQPTVTLKDESTGVERTVPLNIPPPPGQPQPQQQAPPKKK
ncbi:MAG: preprotein translocase subunit SecG [Acidobacteria bacterium]|nr:preprotein translocase subunit SecG [Acidobacteriota bacterium]